ncbi:MAG: FAD-dependent oxidoreductase [Chloroflexi bacterium]|nr:MAG: FAD-dependent oxidoreductase [Chloroflexota bacterium]
MGANEVEKLQAIVVGGGQAGLATGYELARRGVSFAVLEAEERIGDQWRRRWDSLRLFTPARYDALPGSTFPAPPASFPGKDEMADYLEAYSRSGGLPVRTGVRAVKLARSDGSYVMETTSGVMKAAHVVVATGYQKPKLPPFAADLKPAIKQLAAGQYRSPAQLTGDVLVVGAGTSGVEIAIEAAKAGHRTVLAGRGTGAIPGVFYAFNGKAFWFYANRIASVRTPMGRRMKPLVLTHGAPLIRVKMRDALAAGVERAPRVTAVESGLPVFEGGRRMEPATIVWCTGFTRDYSWIEFPVAGPDGYPRHTGGVAEGESGLYFVGLPFQTRLASGLIGGVGEDAGFVADAIATRLRHAHELRQPSVADVELALGHR